MLFVDLPLSYQMHIRFQGLIRSTLHNLMPASGLAGDGKALKLCFGHSEISSYYTHLSKHGKAY